MADIYEHWHQHMTSAAANLPGAGEEWVAGLPTGPPQPSGETFTATDAMQWLTPLVMGLLHATGELAREVDRLRDDVEELNRGR